MRLVYSVYWMNPATKNVVSVTENEGCVCFIAPGQEEADLFTKTMLEAGFQITGEMKSIAPD